MAAESEVVGREQELAAIDAFLDAPPGGPAALLVEGEAGIGKTTLWLAAVQAAGSKPGSGAWSRAFWRAATSATTSGSASRSCPACAR